MQGKNLIKLLQKTEHYGINSIAQLKIFIQVAEANGISYAQLAGNDDSQSPENKAIRTQVRRLSTGYRRSEGHWADGLDLVQVVDEGLPTDTWGRNYLKVVTLTTRGKRLHNQIQKIMG